MTVTQKSSERLITPSENYARLEEDVESVSSIAVSDDFPEEQRHYPKGTPASSIINLSNTILGSGMLALPSALAATGLVQGLFLIIFCASASAFGLYLLSRVASQLGRKASFFNCASITYPSFAVFFDIAIAVKCFGVSISYLVIFGGILPQIVNAMAPGTEADSVFRSREFWITVGILMVVPSCFMPNLDSLKYTSGFSLFAVAYLVLVVVKFYLFPSVKMPAAPSLSEIELFKFDSNTLAHLPIFVFAFTCHQNIFAIHNELEDNSPEVVESVIKKSISICFVVYQLIGTAGLLTFGMKVSPNIITQYPPSDVITGAQIAIAFLVLFSYPLQAHPCRNSLDKVITSGSDVSMSNSRFSGITVSILILSYIIAISVSDLSLILALVGATGSTAICYILPGLFYYKFSQNMRAVNGSYTPVEVLAVGLIGLGFIVMFTSITNIFYGIASNH